MEYVIVGNGIIGLSTAFRLLQRIGSADRVTIVGPQPRPGSATLAAAAMLNSFAEIEYTSLKSTPSQYYFELSHHATHLWPKFEREMIDAAGDRLPEECATCEIHSGGCFKKGTYVVNNAVSDELDDRNFDAIVEALETFNEQHTLVDPGTIPNYFPSAHARATRAVLIHNEGWLNPRIVVKKLDRILARDPRATFVDARAAKVEKDEGRISAVVLESGERIVGDRYLLANGADFSDFVARSELGLPFQRVFYGVGVSIEIQCEEHPHQFCIRTPNRGGACGIYTVPYFQGPHEPNDHILIGASNFLSPKPVDRARLVSVEHLMASAMHEINNHFYDAKLVRVNVGWRPTSQDLFPLLGPTALENLFVATGTKRDGFHLAPVVSDMMARIMLGETVDDRFEIFNPERPVLRTMTREEGIDVGVTSLLSQHAQHGYKPSGIRMHEQLKGFYRADLEALHDAVGAKDWGIPPELINMYSRGHAK